MARIRSVHPGQWTDGHFVSMSPLGRLLSIAIRNEADDNGIFRWMPLQIKIRCLPADSCDIEALLEELIEHRQIIRYEVDGETYGLIRGFDRYQRPRYPSYLHPVPVEPLPAGWNLRAAQPAIKSEGGRNASAIPRSPRRDLGISKTAIAPPALADEKPEPKKELTERPDPLEAYPALAEFWEPLNKMIQAAHPHTKLPKPGSKGEYNARKTLADIVRLDKFTEKDVVETMRWLFEGADRDAVFWRQQVQSVPPLRVRKPGQGMTKFAKIHHARGDPTVPRVRDLAEKVTWAEGNPFAPAS